MKLSNYIRYSFLKLKRDKRNHYYIIVLSLCTLVLIATLFFQDNYFNIIQTNYDSSLYRNLIVGPKSNSNEYDVEELKNISHVSDVYSMKYNRLTYYTETFKSDIHDGGIEFVYGSENSLPKNIIGSSYKNIDSGNAICSKTLYPSFAEPDFYSIDNIFINAEKLINTTFKINTELFKRIDGKIVKQEQNYMKEFKIIGVFDPKETGDTLRTCYLSPKDMTLLYQDLNDYLNPNTLYAMVVSVDNNNNISSVRNSLSKLGYDRVSMQIIPNYYLTNNVVLISAIVIIVIVFTIIIVSLSYVKKRIINNNYDIGLLKVLGFKEIIINKIYLLSSLWLSIIACATGIIIFELLIMYLKHYYHNFIIYNNYYIDQNIFVLTIPLFIIIILPVLITYLLMKKINNITPIMLVKGTKA